MLPVMNVYFQKNSMPVKVYAVQTLGVLATTPNVMASLQAHHALLYLGLGTTALKQKLLLWDGRSMKQKILAFEKDPIVQSVRQDKAASP